VGTDSFLQHQPNCKSELRANATPNIFEANGSSKQLSNVAAFSAAKFPTNSPADKPAYQSTIRAA
jgi:hypothetical protein